MILFLASYGKREILLFGLFWILLGAGLGWLFPPAALVPLCGLLFTLYFFRDPHRDVPAEPEAIVSPADGTVVEISEAPAHELLGEDAVKIGIILSVFNVHVNRAPCAGTVKSILYTSGSFRDAHDPECGKYNEQNAIHIDGAVPVLVTQIAGLIARRIVCAITENDTLEKGQRIGMIKFGSRTDLYIPKSRVGDIRIQLKEKVKGGETVLVRTTGK